MGVFICCADIVEETGEQPSLGAELPVRELLFSYCHACGFLHLAFLPLVKDVGGNKSTVVENSHAVVEGVF